MNRLQITIGERYGRWSVVNPDRPPKSVNKYRLILCRCDCGVERDVLLSSLRNGKSASCGCLHRELVVQQNTTHNLSGHALYSVYESMLKRCNNPKSTTYMHYGGRGIAVCAEWSADFTAFYEWAIASGWATGLQIDRIDNDRGYEPSNCRFVTGTVNARNTRRSRRWVINGSVYDSAQAAADVLSVSEATIHRWCSGRMQGDHYTPPLPNCYSELLYKEPAR